MIKPRKGLAFRKSRTSGWDVYDLRTGKLDSWHTTEAQSRTWAKQINEQTFGKENNGEAGE